MTDVEAPVDNAGRTPMLDRPLGELEVVASLTEMQSRGKIPLSRFIHGSAEINGKIFVCGGRDKESNSLSDTFLYDPVTSTCHELAELPKARCGHTLMAHNDKLVCFGGYDGTNFYNEVLTYDPKENKWNSEVSNGPPARYCHTGAIVDDKMYIMGGDNHKDKLADLWSLDLTSFKWTEMKLKGKTQPDCRQGSVAAAHNGKLYSFGGFDKQKHSATNEMWCFDPEKSEWTEIEAKGTVPNGRHGHAGVVFGDSWIIHGGRKDHGEKYNIDVYDFQFDVNEWRRLGVVQHAASPWGCPAVRFGHQAVLEPFTNAIVITGGYTHTDGVTFCPTNSIMRLDLLPTLHSVTSITSRIAPLESKTEQLVEDAKDLKEDVAGLQDKMKELEEDAAEVKERQEKIENALTPLIETVPRVEDAVKGAEEKIGDLEDNNKALGEKVDGLDDDAKELDDRVTKLEDNVNQLQDLAGVSKDQDDIKKDVADIRDRALPSVNDNINDVAKKSEEYQAKLDELQDKLNDLEEKEKELDDRENKLEEKENDLENKIDEIQKELAAMREDGDKLRDDLGDVGDLKDKIDQLDQQNQDLRDNVSNLVDLSELYKRVEALRKAMDKTIEETRKMRDLGEMMAGYGAEIPKLDFDPYFELDDVPDEKKAEAEKKEAPKKEEKKDEKKAPKK